MKQHILLIIGVFLLSLNAYDIVDYFESPISLLATGDNPVVTNTTVGGIGIAGFRRDFTVTRTFGADNSLGTRCSIIDSRFSLSNDVSVFGSCTAFYPGIDGNGFDSPLDLTDNGRSCFNFRVTRVDRAPGISAIFRNSETFQDIELNYSLPSFLNTPIDVCLPFGTSLSDFNSVDQVKYELKTNFNSGADIDIDYACAQPAVSCWHLINPDAYTTLKVGDEFNVNVTCENYEKFPELIPEVISGSFVFNSTMGFVKDGSVSCTGTTSSGVSNGVMEFEATLAQNQQASCSFVVQLTGPGIAKDLAASITTAAGEEEPIRSNEQRSVQGTFGFCKDPQLSSVTVYPAPEPVPCRRQRKCFRIAQSNDCVFASNCVERECDIFCKDTPECRFEPICSSATFWYQRSW